MAIRCKLGVVDWVSASTLGVLQIYKNRICVWKNVVAILILLRKRGTADSNNWHMHFVDMPMGLSTRELVMWQL